ncbi:MAG TPA: disulfide bond formation protein B [Quisquiliibacterium sp.]|nr:disulfide bond formation protein B [Quisquiliibacterium sp.]
MPELVPMHRRLLALCAFASLGGVAVGLVLQHQFGMEPCAWCVVQRMFYVLVGGFSLAALALGGMPIAALGAMLLADLSATLGLASALFHQFVAARPGGCGITIADKFLMATSLHEHLPWLMNPTAMCDEANQPLLGVPFAVWSIALFTLLLIGVGFALVGALRGMVARRGRATS